MANNFSAIPVSLGGVKKYHASIPVQGRRGPGDAQNMVKFTCSGCRIDYQMRETQKAVCPLCDEKDRNEHLRIQIDTLAQELEMTRKDLERARSESDLVQTMRHALLVAEPDDLAQIKAIVYRWRADPDNYVVLGASKGRGRNRSIVIELRQRKGDSEFFVPTSVGGVAFVASYYDLVKARGAARAMEGYAQAMAPYLA